MRQSIPVCLCAICRRQNRTHVRQYDFCCSSLSHVLGEMSSEHAHILRGIEIPLTLYFASLEQYWEIQIQYNLLMQYLRPHVHDTNAVSIAVDLAKWRI